MTVASRIAVMDHGKVIQVDTPDRIYEAPNSVYVADFIGDVNIIPGRSVNPQGDLIDLEWAPELPFIRGTVGGKLTDGGSAHFMIRPEKISISAEEPTELNNRMQGQVEDIAYLGNISTYHVRMPNGTRNNTTSHK